MNDTQIKPLRIDGCTLDVFVSETGEFSSRWNGDRIAAPTLKALREKRQKQIRSAGRIAVPCTLIEDMWHSDKPRITQITLVGIHAGNSNPLYKEDGEDTTEQLRWSGSKVFRRLTDEEIAEFLRLKQEITAAEAALEAWKAERSVNPTTLLTDAQDAALKQGAATS